MVYENQVNLEGKGEEGEGEEEEEEEEDSSLIVMKSEQTLTDSSIEVEN